VDAFEETQPFHGRKKKAPIGFLESFAVSQVVVAHWVMIPVDRAKMGPGTVDGMSMTSQIVHHLNPR